MRKCEQGLVQELGLHKEGNKRMKGLEAEEAPQKI